MLMLLYTHFASLFDFTPFSIDFAHGAHQASKIIVDFVAKKMKWKNEMRRKKNNKQLNFERSHTHTHTYNNMTTTTYSKGCQRCESTLMRLTLVSKLVRTFDHVGLSQSNNREQKQRKSRTI